MIMFRTLVLFGLLTSASWPVLLLAQNSPATAAPSKPTEHVLGTVTALDASARTVTVKEDKSGVEIIVSVAGTKTLLKVAPGAKDIKSAVRMTASDLQVGDRVDVRGSKADASPPVIEARSVVLMSARELAQKRQAEAEAWQNSTVGTVTAVDPAASVLTVSVGKPEGPKIVTVQTSGTTEWTRYSPADPKIPIHSAFADLQPGDQVRVLGKKSSDESSITADKAYSAPVRTIAATVISIAPDGKQITAKNLQSKQPVTILLPATATVRKLDPQMAMMMARRFSGGAPGANRGAAGPGGPPSGGANGDHSASPRAPSAGSTANSGEPAGSGGPGGPNGAGGAGSMPRGGDLSHLLERIPEIPAASLKPGDAIVIWGMAGQAPGSVDAQTVLAGVESVLQSAPIRQGQSLGGDWGLDMGTPAQ